MFLLALRPGRVFTAWNRLFNRFNRLFTAWNPQPQAHTWRCGMSMGLTSLLMDVRPARAVGPTSPPLAPRVRPSGAQLEGMPAAQRAPRGSALPRCHTNKIKIN